MVGFAAAHSDRGEASGRSCLGEGDSGRVSQSVYQEERARLLELFFCEDCDGVSDFSDFLRRDCRAYDEFVYCERFMIGGFGVGAGDAGEGCGEDDRDGVWDCRGLFKVWNFGYGVP